MVISIPVSSTFPWVLCLMRQEAAGSAAVSSGDPQELSPLQHSMSWAGTGVLGAASPHCCLCLCVWGVGTALRELWGSGQAEWGW